MATPQIILTSDDPQLTPRDDKKKMASEILKHVDQLIKKNDFERALIELYHAKEIDPRNVYAQAMEERIMELKTEAVKNNISYEQQDFIPAENTNPPAVPLSKKTGPTPEEIEIYRKALVNAWSNGYLKPEENEKLNALRQQYMISDADHQLLQKEAMRIGYQHSLTQKNAQAPEQSPTPVRHRVKPKDKILIIDDDPRLLELLTASLQDSGFEVIALTTSDEAYALLRKFTPDLILCDINLETSTMGGFTFYEKIQEFKHIHQIPFIFLTGLTDEALVRTGKELGVDDYLTKPISEETLLSTLRGKLKRFKQLKNIITPQQSHVNVVAS
ncbi:MAG: response regulator [Bacteroidetes bacterium]|nr:response regulator [Bacteroidota bacterium]